MIDRVSDRERSERDQSIPYRFQKQKKKKEISVIKRANRYKYCLPSLIL